MEKIIYTVGHSTHEWPYFLQLLRQHNVHTLADIRRFPASRRSPWFGQGVLANRLSALGMRYVHLPALGGRRSASRADSPNDGWQVPAFRAYADYALTESFRTALAALEALAQSSTTAYMCAEQTHFQCHRRIVSDYLRARGWQVYHILGSGQLQEHAYTTHLCLTEGQLSYPRVVKES